MGTSVFRDAMQAHGRRFDTVDETTIEWGMKRGRSSAEASKFVVYVHEFELNGSRNGAATGYRLNTYGEDHVKQIAAALLAGATPQYVIVERSWTSTRDNTRFQYPIHVNDYLDMKRREVARNETPLELKPKEMELLIHFMRNRGRAFTREQLLREVWGYDFYGDSRTVDVHISWLRQKIEPQPGKPVRILTVRGVGYRFEG